ncbi:ABC transporter permease [Salininema proteolyticum]|uniref:ABC transporter permease n=1 Tax=Salininema proteolyticum TaxID=1607685 RepID=A0ABV8U4E4_9ACTN
MTNFWIVLTNTRWLLTTRWLLAALIALVITAALTASLIVTHHRLDVDAKIATDRPAATLLVNQSDGGTIRHSDLDTITALPGVENAWPWTTTGGSVTTGSDHVVLWAVPYTPTGLPIVRESTRANVWPLAPGEAIVPDTVDGRDLSGLLGDQVAFEGTVATGPNTGSETRSHTFTVVGVYDASVGTFNGPDSLYLHSDDALAIRADNDGTTPESLLETQGVAKAVVATGDPEMAREIARHLSDAGYYAIPVSDGIGLYDDTYALIDQAAAALGVLLVVLSLAIGLVVAATVTSSRRREIGILKAIGFTTKRIMALMGGEFVLFAASALAAGIVASCIVAIALASWWHDASVLTAYLHTFADGLTLFILATPFLGMIAGMIVPLSRTTRVPADVALRSAST